jgi:type II restriction/modification system DNA methylase subunit YeeA
MVCFGKNESKTTRLNGQAVAVIHADLTAGNGEENTNITQAKILIENAKTSFIGTQKSGAFDVAGEVARVWLTQPNPNGKPNSEVVKPWSNGMDITRRSSDTWIVDFGVSMNEADASLFELPFEYAKEFVKPVRIGKREEKANEKWWIHQRSRPELRKAVAPLKRFIATPRVSKHRFFVWLPVAVLPDTRLTVIARSDDTTFGILHSRFHQLWSLATCSWHGVGNDPTYNAVSCFETFPFPNGLTPADNAEDSAISEAAINLNQLREVWLNPEIWVNWVITTEEETAGFPKRPIAKAGFEADLKKRTLTNFYNKPPPWFENVQQTLDKAVATAYGWDDYTPEMKDEEILRRLLKLNLERAGK